MNVVVENQLYVFGWAVFYGVMIGISYDLIRILRRIVGHSRVVVGIEDFFFWIIAGLFVFDYIFNTNSGSMRGFIFIGISLGILLYLMTLSKWIVAQVTKLLVYLIKTIKSILRVLLTPLVVVLKPFRFFAKKTTKGLKKSEKWAIIKLRRFMKEIYYILKKI